MRINHQCIYKALGPYLAVGQRNKPPPLMLLKLDEQLSICACVKMLKLEYISPFYSSNKACRNPSWCFISRFKSYFLSFYSVLVHGAFTHVFMLNSSSHPAR